MTTMTLRHSETRGHTRIDWLDSYHTFSFGDYYDPGHMGFSDLRVINDDRVEPGTGFGTHGHRDMEIITIVLEGELAHQDSMGNGSVIRPGDVQRMTAGTGVTHSEKNPSPTDPVHLLQIWILPEKKGLMPGYEQTTFDPAEREGKLRLVASRDGREGSLTVHQDVELYLGLLNPGDEVTYTVQPGRSAWVHVATGQVQLNGEVLNGGDGVGMTQPQTLTLVGQKPQSQVLLFNLRP